MLDNVLNAVGGIAGLFGVGVAGALAFVFRSRIGAIAGGGNLAIVAIMLAGVAGFWAGMQSTKGEHKAYTKAVLNQSEAFLNRTAWIENRALSEVEIHLRNANEQARVNAELLDLIAVVAKANEEGRKRAEMRIATLREQNNRTRDILEKRIQLIDQVRREEITVNEYLQTPVPVELRNIDRLRDSGNSGDDNTGDDMPGSEPGRDL